MQLNLKSILVAAAVLLFGVAVSFAVFLRAPQVFRASAELDLGKMKTIYRRSVKTEVLVPVDFILETHAGVQVGIDPVSNPALILARRLPRVEIIPPEGQLKNTLLYVFATSAEEADAILAKSIDSVLKIHEQAFVEMSAEQKEWKVLNEQCKSALRGGVPSAAQLTSCFVRDRLEDSALWASAQSVELSQTRLVGQIPAAPIRSSRRQHLIVGFLIGGALLGAWYSFQQLRRIRKALPA